jgi:hypothetical protein
MTNHRRRFMLLGAQAAGALSIAVSGLAQAEERLTQADPVAQALGYKEDASKVDNSNAHYVAGSACANCQLYQGKPGDAAGDCPIFHKLVSAKGWCNSYTKKG